MMRLRPMCRKCGWAKGGLDSWDGVRCKCKLTEPEIQLVSTGVDTPTATMVQVAQMPDIQISRRTGQLYASTPRGETWVKDTLEKDTRRVNPDVVDEIAKQIEAAGLTVEVK